VNLFKANHAETTWRKQNKSVESKLLTKNARPTRMHSVASSHMKELEFIKKQLKETKNIINTRIPLLNEKIKFLEQEMVISKIKLRSQSSVEAELNLVMIRQ
jgi:hypothetical protein